MNELKQRYIPKGSELIDAIRNIDGPHFNNHISTWRLKLMLEKLNPGKAIRNYDLRRELIKLENVGVLTAERSSNNIVWSLKKGAVYWGE